MRIFGKEYGRRGGGMAKNAREMIRGCVRTQEFPVVHMGRIFPITWINRGVISGLWGIVGLMRIDSGPDSRQ